MYVGMDLSALPVWLQVICWFIVGGTVLGGILAIAWILLRQEARLPAPKYVGPSKDNDYPEVSPGEGPGPPGPLTGAIVPGDEQFMLHEGAVRCLRCSLVAEPGDSIRYTGQREGLAVHCPGCNNNFTFPVPLPPRHAKINLLDISRLRKHIRKVESGEPFTEAEADNFCELAGRMTPSKELPINIGIGILRLVADLVRADIDRQKEEKAGGLTPLVPPFRAKEE